MSPIFTGYVAIGALFNVKFLQLFSDMYYHHYWAHGSILMILMTIFGWSQYLCMFMLLQNSEAYLYDFRMTRYLSLLLATAFDFIYLVVLKRVYDLLFIKALRDHSDNAFDLLNTVVLGYMSVFYAPDFIINALIFLKELTLKQSAWSKEEDYTEGFALNGLVDIDILDWIEVEEDYDWYLAYLKKWCKKFC
jgi:hypothetical protein